MIYSQRCGRNSALFGWPKYLRLFEVCPGDQLHARKVYKFRAPENTITNGRKKLGIQAMKIAGEILKVAPISMMTLLSDE